MRQNGNRPSGDPQAPDGLRGEQLYFRVRHALA
jgi:hypothetical protein